MSVGMVALIGAILAPVCGLIGTWYGARRAAQVQERKAKQHNDAMTQRINKVDAVEQAHIVLVGTIEQMRQELDRQDEEHAKANEEHAKAIADLRARLEAIRSHHEQCERDRDELQRDRDKLQQRVWDLERAG